MPREPGTHYPSCQQVQGVPGVLQAAVARPDDLKLALGQGLEFEVFDRGRRIG